MSRSVSMTYLTMIQNNQQMIMADLFTFTLQTGAVDRFTDFDMDLTIGGHLYKSGSLRISGLKMKLEVGLNVDEQEIKIAASPSDTLAGGAFLLGCGQGLLDGATLQRDRAVWAAGGGTSTGGAAAVDAMVTPVTVIRMSYGLVSEITKIGRTSVELKVKSPLKLLDINLPRRTYQGSCNWTLFDAGCTLSKGSYGTSGTVNTFPELNNFGWSGGTSPNIGADGWPYYAQGRVLFTSGPLTNLQLLIVWNDSTNLYTAGMYTLPNSGDTFTAYPGCNKSIQACTLKFSNANNYNGFEFVPPVTLSL
jgi:hypothetical protein